MDEFIEEKIIEGCTTEKSLINMVPFQIKRNHKFTSNSLVRSNTLENSFVTLELVQPVKSVPYVAAYFC